MAECTNLSHISYDGNEVNLWLDKVLEGTVQPPVNPTTTINFYNVVVVVLSSLTNFTCTCAEHCLY